MHFVIWIGSKCRTLWDGGSSGRTAGQQKMFDKYGLNKSQAGILFMLHHEEAVSQSLFSEGAGKNECDGAVYYICDSEDGEGWIYQTTAGRKGSKDHASVSGWRERRLALNM